MLTYIVPFDLHTLIGSSEILTKLEQEALTSKTINTSIGIELPTKRNDTAKVSGYLMYRQSAFVDPESSDEESIARWFVSGVGLKQVVYDLRFEQRPNVENGMTTKLKLKPSAMSSLDRMDVVHHIQFLGCDTPVSIEWGVVGVIPSNYTNDILIHEVSKYSASLPANTNLKIGLYDDPVSEVPTRVLDYIILTFIQP